jgi:unsaturated rhamnogalacturonyl hydrolase
MTEVNRSAVESKLAALFSEIIAVREDDAHLKSIGAYGSDMSIELWDWSQGVGLYGIWRLYKATGKKEYLDYLYGWYDRHIRESSVKNVNYAAPMLTLVSMSQDLDDLRHLPLIKEFCGWIEHDLLRTEMEGFAHTTAARNNENQLWVDTLFMCGLFYAKAGLLLDTREYFDETVYQYLLHTQFLSDPATGLWRHGWSFSTKNHAAGALWGRGNGWACATGADLCEMAEGKSPSERLIRNNFKRQCRGLLERQDASGLWHTLIDDPDSYLESSASAAIAYGFLKGARLGILGAEYAASGKAAVSALLERINDKGELSDVSSGTPVFATLDEYRNVPIRQRSYGQSLAMIALSEMLLHPELLN